MYGLLYNIKHPLYSTGDPNETEVDTILLLTDELYLVAEYDSHLDKIVRFERVPLANVTLVEFGQSAAQSKIFHSAGAARPCIRINYAVDTEDGYFHMFRSANIRFFNNVAVVTKTPDEILGELWRFVMFLYVFLIIVFCRVFNGHCRVFPHRPGQLWAEQRSVCNGGHTATP